MRDLKGTIDVDVAKGDLDRWAAATGMAASLGLNDASCSYDAVALRGVINGPSLVVSPSVIKSTCGDVCVGGTIPLSVEHSRRLWALLRLPPAAGEMVRLPRSVVALLRDPRGRIILPVDLSQGLKRASIDLSADGLGDRQDGAADKADDELFFGALRRCW
jgi:hypothetical protein